MKIHSHVIAYSQTLRNALAETTTGCVLQICNPSGSRSHPHAFVVALESDGTPDQHGAARRYRRNTGVARRHRTEDPGYAASYADWGHWLARLFELDPGLYAGPYRGSIDFHEQTRYAFASAELVAERDRLAALGAG